MALIWKKNKARNKELAQYLFSACWLVEAELSNRQMLMHRAHRSADTRANAHLLRPSVPCSVVLMCQVWGNSYLFFSRFEPRDRTPGSGRTLAKKKKKNLLGTPGGVAPPYPLHTPYITLSPTLIAEKGFVKKLFKDAKSSLDERSSSRRSEICVICWYSHT